MPKTNQFASKPVQEDEIKLNADDKRVINAAWSWVLKNTKHYHPAFHNHGGPKKQDNIDWDKIRQYKPRAPRRVRELLTRYYYDTRNLSLHKNGIELRIAEKDGAFKQVIKIGDKAGALTPMLRRIEYTGLMPAPKPNLSLIGKNAEDRDETIRFLKQSVKDEGRIKPVIAIEGQRRRRSYHPDGNRDVTIEFAADLGTGINVKGFVWHIMQVEFEIKENNTSNSNAEILMYEGDYLTRKFRALAPGFESKPTPGFQAFNGNSVMGEKKWGRQPVETFEVLAPS